MPILSHININKFCNTNQILLRQREFVDQNQYMNLEKVNVQDQKDLINELLVNEKDNIEGIVEIYRKEKNKVEYILQSMTVAVIFLGAGFALAQLFIASTVILPPIFPLLLVGFAIIAATKLILCIKTNSLEADKNHAVNILNQLREIDESDGQESIRTLSRVVKDFNETIGVLKEKNVNNSSQIMAKLGTFQGSKPIPVPVPENKFHTEEIFMSWSPRR